MPNRNPAKTGSYCSCYPVYILADKDTASITPLSSMDQEERDSQQPESPEPSFGSRMRSLPMRLLRLPGKAIRAMLRVILSKWIPNGRSWIQSMSRGFKVSLFLPLALAAIAALVEFGLTISLPDPGSQAWSPRLISQASEARLLAIRQNLDSEVYLLNTDITIRKELDDSLRQPIIFQRLIEDFITWQASTPDSMKWVWPGDRRDTAARGSAIYDGDGRLVAWSSTAPGIFGFDTVLPERLTSSRYIQCVRLEKNFFYTYLTEVLKLPGASRNAGYAVARRLLAYNEYGSGGPAASSTFLDDIRDRSGRDFEIEFNVTPDTSTDSPHAELFGVNNDPESHLCTLRFGDRVTAELPTSIRLLRAMRTLSLLVALLLFLGWFMVRLVNKGTRSFGKKVLHSLAIVLGVTVVRVLMLFMTGLTDLLANAIQDPSQFASDQLLGVAADPLQLFVTTLFSSIALIAIWMIWMPEERFVDEPIVEIEEGADEEGEGSEKKLSEYIPPVLAIIALSLLTDLVVWIVQSIVSDGSVQYLVIKQVLPPPSTLMLYLSFLNIGVSYVFASSLFLVFALRSILRLLPLAPLKQRIITASILLLLMATAGAFVAEWIGLTTIPIEYRLLLHLGMCLVISVVMAVDMYQSNPFDEQTSVLYRLPRSSRSILFVLAVSAFIVSPIVMNKEMAKDQDIALETVSDNSEADAPYLKTIIEQSLAEATQKLPKWSTGGIDDLKESAYYLWVSSLRGHPDWRTVIDVYTGFGNRISHFSTTGAENSSNRSTEILDSVSNILREASAGTDSGKPAPLTIETVDAFGAAGTPLLLGATRIPIRTAARAPSNGYVIVRIALWSEPAAFQPSPAFLLGQARGEQYSDQFGSSDQYIVTQYRDGVRVSTNVPTLDVPAVLPASIKNRLASQTNIWSRSSIGSKPYLVLYHKMAATSGRNSAGHSVLALSISEPGFTSGLEFGLRLNAIGLLYGVFFALFLVLLRQLGPRVNVDRRFTLKFRDRIFLIVLSISLIPLIVVTNVTQTLLREPAVYQARDNLARDANVLREQIGRKVASGNESVRSPEFQQDVENLSHTIGRNFSVYDARGMLVASSRPEYFESALLPNHLSASSMQSIVVQGASFFSEPINIGSEAFQIGYVPVNSGPNGALSAIVSVATYGENASVGEEIARTTSLIYGTFAALGLVLLGIGALFAARIASPIMTLISATENVAKGKLHTSIAVTREDEIGDLMQAFNEMTSELEKSRQLVAQTEREVAWKEMARQVAHEIKNPLTPMKLSVQHVEHAHETKDPNFNSIFRRVIRTLSEQIDVLTRIATEFARFGEMPRRKYALTSVRSLSERAVALFDADRYHIRFLIDIPKDLPYINVDEEEFRRALVNLIRNAIQAIAGWGVIAIRATSDKQMVHIRISDTGSGMSDETLKRAFDPNFSTKTSGMGLGLAIVKKTVTDMGGIINVESQIGKGTTFSIDIPARERPD